MATVNVGIGVSQTDKKIRRELMKSAFSIGDLDYFNMAFKSIPHDTTFTLSFENMLVCSVNVPTLIQITIEDNTLEFVLREGRTFVLPATGSAVFSNAEEDLTLISEVQFVTV